MRKQQIVPLMALTVLIDFTGFGIIIPLLPFWAQHVGANPVQIGLIITVYSLAQFLFLPVLGRLSDRFGRRPVILASLAIEALSFALTGLAGSLLFLLFARFIGGMGSANFGSAQAVVADTTEPGERARGMGFIGAATGLGFVIGPALGGGLAALGPTVPFWAAMVLAIINAVLVFFLLPETRARRSEEVVSAVHTRFQLNTTIEVFRHPALARIMGINLLYALAFTAMESMYPLFSEHLFGWHATQNAYIFVYVGVIMVIVQGGLVGQLSKRFGVQTMFRVGLALLALGLLLLPLGANLAIMFLALGLLSAGSGAVAATSSAIASLNADREAQGETLSIIQSVGSLGRIIGPLLAGWIYARAGVGSPFMAGGLLIVVALFLAMPAFAAATATPTAPSTAHSPQA